MKKPITTAMKYEDLTILKPEIEQKFIEAAIDYDKRLINLIYMVDNNGINSSSVKEIQDKAHHLLLDAEYYVLFPSPYRSKKPNDETYDEKQYHKLWHSHKMLFHQWSISKDIYRMCGFYKSSKDCEPVIHHYKRNVMSI